MYNKARGPSEQAITEQVKKDNTYIIVANIAQKETVPKQRVRSK